MLCRVRSTLGSNLAARPIPEILNGIIVRIFYKAKDCGEKSKQNELHTKFKTEIYSKL